MEHTSTARTLLDVGGLPIEEIAVLARKEAFRPRDTYQAHKWFARRLAITARTLLVASVTPADGGFWQAYHGTASCEGLKVLDPFMGGGVMLLEASRLGADVYGYDVEPVAVAVSSFQGRLPTVPDLTDALEFLQETVGQRLEPFYATRDANGTPERMLHAFRTQVITCGSCGHDYDAQPNFRIAADRAKRSEWIVCRSCGDVSVRDSSNRAHVCACGSRTSPDEGTVRKGKACCPSCGHQEKLIDIARREGRPRFRIFAVETLPDGPERKTPLHGRRIRAASSFDLAAQESAEQALAAELARNPSFLPECAIPTVGRSDARLTSYGYRDYREMFAPRQLLHVGLLAEEISGLTGIVGEAMRFAFSDHLATNNLFCAYASEWRRLSPLFSIKAYRHICRPVEINPWLVHNGRGTFPNAVRSVARAARDIVRSQEPSLAGSPKSVPRKDGGGWTLRCADSTSLDAVGDRTIDLVLTDPPYFDYISYSELGHFYVPWMARLGLIGPIHLDGLPEGQLAAQGRSKEDQEAFTRKLTAVFTECGRVAKPGARLVFTYQNYDGRGWRSLGQAMGRAGIRLTTVWPMFGDSGASIQKSGRSISWDCVVVAQFGNEPVDLMPNDDDSMAGSRMSEDWSRRLQAAGFPLTEGDRSNIAHAGGLLAASVRLATLSVPTLTDVGVPAC